MNKQELINKLKYLKEIDDEKQKQFRLEIKSSEEVGCVTKEGFLIASLLPEMQRLNINLEDIG